MKGLIVYALGAAFLGGVIGLITGLSETSAVTTVLGSVFALLGAAGSFYVPWSQGNASPGTVRQTVSEEALSAARGEAGAAAVARKQASLDVAAAMSAHKAAQEATAKAAQAREALPQDAAADTVTAADEALIEARTAEATAKAAAEAAEKTLKSATDAAVAADERVRARVDEADGAAKEARILAEEGFTKSYVASGGSLMAFSLGFLVAMLYGALLRTGSNWDDLLPQTRTIEVTSLVDADTAVNAILIDRLLAGLRVDPDARKVVLDRIDNACDNDLEIVDVAATAALAQLVPNEVRTRAGNFDHINVLAEALPADASVPVSELRTKVASAAIDAMRVRLVLELAGDAPLAVAALKTLEEVALEKYLTCNGAARVASELIANIKALDETSVGDAVGRTTSIENK